MIDAEPVMLVVTRHECSVTSDAQEVCGKNASSIKSMRITDAIKVGVRGVATRNSPSAPSTDDNGWNIGRVGR